MTRGIPGPVHPRDPRPTVRPSAPGRRPEVARSRRRFLGDAGVVVAALLFDGAGVLARLGRTVTTRGNIVLPPEDLTRLPLPDRPAQPGQVARYRPTLRARIGQMMLVGFGGTVVDGSSPIVRDITEQHLGGVLLFDRRPGSREAGNIVSPEQLAELVGILRGFSREAGLAPLLVATDQEGGAVARLNPGNGFAGTYSPAILGAMNDPGFTAAQAREIARTLASVGINFNLAPVVDLNLNAANRVIGGDGRTFSGDASVAVAHAAAFIRGHRAEGVGTAIKHFPGQGSASGDTHHGWVDVTGSWTEYELEPFRALIADGLADAVMTAHIFNAGIDATHPATLSPATLQTTLRDGLGFDGVIVSDDLTMGAISATYRYEDAVRLAVLAGVDLLTVAHGAGGLVARTIDVIEGMVATGSIPESRINASFDRILALKATLTGD